jgi:uncharacterized protein (DUF488 family)
MRVGGSTPNANEQECGSEKSPGYATSPLFTIGYGARTLEQFLAALQLNRIEYLIDVRTAPYSKFKPEFSRELLQHHVERAGLHYLFMGDLLGGQPKDPSCHTEGKIDYDKVRIQPFFQSGIDRLRKAFEQQRRVALMCSEGKPEQCHRSKLIGEALDAVAVPICHIDEDGRLLTQREVIERLTKGQMDLFGASSFHSRKRYASREDEDAGQGG